MPTEHFVIYFHQGEGDQAQRLAVIAEETWHALQRPLGTTPPRLTHVVLADQTELANGYATPLPYDTIVIFAVRPSGSQFLFDDWLRLAFTHEFTHIVHLDRSEGWARAVRSVFGRTSFGFPNLFLPAWQIEGLATYEESAITGEGRLHAGDFRAIVGEAARQRALEPLDRVNGGLTDWPGGAAVYAYGLGFHQYLVDRFGAQTLGALAAATARYLPYTASRAFERVYGESLGHLWRDYEATLVGNIAAVPVDPGLTRLTHQGFSISGPRFDRFVCASCSPEILYSARNANGFPALYRVGLDGAKPRRVTTRYLGSTMAIGREVVYFDQMEIRRDVGLYSDLYEWSRATGRVRPLTREARLLDPDLSPDEQTLVCVQDHLGQRDLVLVRLRPDTTGTSAAASVASGFNRAVDDASVVSGFSRTVEDASVVSGFSRTVAIDALISEPDTQFDAPKWSPDGRTIAVERHRLGAMPEIVTVDVATRTVRVVASDARARFVMPAWRPDGGAILAAVALDDQTFNVFEIASDGSTTRQLTHTTGGATWPEVSPDGRTLAFVGYTTDGDDVFTMPYPAVQPGDVHALKGSSAIRPATAAADHEIHPTSEYSPLSTLKPTSWSPVVESDSDQLRIGASVAGVDVLGYHAYAATATWLVSIPTGAQTPRAASPDWQIIYAYDRWRPTFYATASSQTSFFAGPATDAGAPTSATRQARAIEGGVLFPIRHVRVLHEGVLSIARAVDDYTLPDGTLSRDRTPLRAAWETITSRRYGYSISPEDGVALGVTAEAIRSGLGSSADATTLTGEFRAYLPAFAEHHVVALRVAGGRSSGDRTVGRTFLLGGDAPGTGVIDFGGTAFSLLRGFASNTFAGSHVGLFNAEYRWPITRPQRGVGTWPILLHTIHAAVFADAGHVWTNAFHAGAIKTSAGAELSTDIVAGYFLPLTATVGAAWGHDGSGAVAGGVRVYVRVGRAF